MSAAAIPSARGLTGGKNLTLTRRLLSERNRANGIDLLAVARVCEGDEADAVFRPLFTELRALPTDSFWGVWTTPAAAFWNQLSLEFLKSRHSGLSPLADSHARWLCRNPDEALTLHLKQLGVFVVAAHLRRGTGCRLPLAVSLDETGTFPNAGVSWQTSSLELLGCTAGGEILVRASGMEQCESVQDSPDGRARFFRTPCVRWRGTLWVDIWATCMRADYEGLERCPRVTAYPAVASATERIASAVQKVDAYSEELATEFAEVVSVVAPLRPVHADAYPSGSCSFCPGAVFFTDTANPDILAELLIHECGHNKLFLLQREDLLLDPNVHGTGWEEAAYYSPWRDARRPLQGILHGFFVFTEVAGFWQWRLEKGTTNAQDHTAERRLKTLCEQLKLAREVLQSYATFTPAGAEVVGELSCRLDALADFATQINGDRIEVMHAEVHSTEAYRGLPVNEAIRRHRADYWPESSAS